MDYEKLRKRCDYHNERYKNMTEEQRERRLAQMREYTKAWRQGIRKGRKKLTEEERKAWKKEYNRKYREEHKKQDAHS